jgi:hypothetical protein
MTTPILMSALVGASVSFLFAVLFNSLRGLKSDKKVATKNRPQEEQVWE